MWSSRVIAVAVLGLLVGVAAKKQRGGKERDEGVSNHDLCKLEQRLNGKVLLADAICCLGKVKPVDYACPVSRGEETFEVTADHYVMDCDDEAPAAVIIAKGVRDVRRVLAYVKTVDVEFRVKSGGHSLACTSTVKDGLVLSLESMQEVEYIHMDDGSVFMTLEAGVTLTELHENYMANSSVYFPHGLDPWIGMGGHLTGGGVGHLTRKFGFSTDFIVGVDVVLPSGKFVRVFEPEYEKRLTRRVSASNKKHQDLLWGLKGSGHANFGVVTKFWMRTIPRPEYVVFGNTYYDIVNETSLEEFWNTLCRYYTKAPQDETAGERNLLTWPMISQSSGALFRVNYIFFYTPDNNSTEQGALDEAKPVVDAFLSNVEGLTFSESRLLAVPQGEQFSRLVDPSTARYSPTCVSRLVPSKEDVCNREGWIGKFATFVHDEITAFPSRGTTFFTYLEKWGGVAALNDPNFERTSLSSRNAWGTLQYCRIPFNAATRDKDSMTYGEGGTNDFNNSVLADLGSGWYANYQDTLATELEHVYSDPRVYERLQKVKLRYDPTNLLNRPFGVPLPEKKRK